MNYFSFDKYSDKKRWASYWHQIDEVLKFNPERVALIGKGDGLVSECLKTLGAETITVDIDESLNPDVKASVLKLPFSDNDFDVVLCAQVLEHLPYEDFAKALLEIKRVAKIGAVVSLPHFGPVLKFFVKIPLFPEIKFMMKIPYPRRQIFKGEHFWEIGRKGFSLLRIRSEIKETGFFIAKEYLAFENPAHRFFVLKK